MPFVRLPAKQIKAVTMGAPMNKYGLQILLPSISLKSANGLSALRSWKSAGSSSASAEHKATPKSSSRSLLAETDLALCWTLECSGWECGCSGLFTESLFKDLDQENSLGGEKEGRVGSQAVEIVAVEFVEGRVILVGTFLMGMVEVMVVMVGIVLGTVVV